MTPEEANALFDRHCAAEAARDLPAIMATLADGAEHDVEMHRRLTRLATLL